MARRVVSKVGRLSVIGTAVAAATVVAGTLMTVGPATAGAVAAPELAPAATAAAGSYTAVTPSRLLDTRTGNGATKRPVAAHGTLVLQVAGRGGIPTTGAAAVALTVTVTSPAAAGNLTVYAYGTARPPTSNLNFTARLTIANLVFPRVGTGGRIGIANNSAGTVELVADVSGYYASGTAGGGGAFVPLTPYRTLDTRIGATGVPAGAVAPHATIAVPVGTGGTGRVPAQGAATAVVNVTVTGATAAGNVAASPAIAGDGTTSNVNFRAGQTIAVLVIAQLDGSGRAHVVNNSAGTVHLVVDVQGYYLNASPTRAGALGAFAPDRVVDSRTVLRAETLAAHSSATVQVAGFAGETPATETSSVLVNITVTNVRATGSLTAYPAGTAAPPTSSLNFSAGATVADLAVVKVGADKQIVLANNSAGSLDVIVDLSAYTLNTTLTVPPTSPSYYVRSLTGNSSHDDALMSSRGAKDGAAVVASDASPRFVVLDFGAQTRPNPAVEGEVELTGTSPVVRLPYSHVVSAVQAYMAGWAGATTSAAAVTVGIGVNNDGDWSAYTANDRATDWWTDVVHPAQSALPSHFSVVGAADLQPRYAASLDEVSAWVTEYAATLAQPLTEIGTVDGCPSGPGAFDTACAPVPVDGGPRTDYWGQDSEFQVACDIAPTKITVLPQIYTLQQAQQWADISLSAEIFGEASINFIGSSTGVGVDSALGTHASQSPAQGWADLHRQESTQLTPTMPYATDFGIL